MLLQERIFLKTLPENHSQPSRNAVKMPVGFWSFFEAKRHKRPHPWWFQTCYDICHMMVNYSTCPSEMPTDPADVPGGSDLSSHKQGHCLQHRHGGSIVFSLHPWWFRNPVNLAVDIWYHTIPLFTGFQHHPRWLFGISEPSTVRPWSSNGDSIGKIRITPYIRDGHLTWKIEKSLNGYINPYHKGWWPSPTAGV